MEKIKLFLAAYINFPNAQNVNCDYIARYINKDIFDVHVMYTDKMPIDKEKYEKVGIHLHRLLHHRYVWYWSKLWCMWKTKADIYYVPKMEIMDVKFMDSRRGKDKKIVASIEGVVGEQIAQDDVQRRIFFEKCDGVFSISDCIRKSVERCWKLNTPILYLGVDEPTVAIVEKRRVQKVIWIGSIIERKRPDYLLECAKKYPELMFTMIGDGDQLAHIQGRIRDEHISNVALTGRIPNEKVYEMLSDADLLLMTSDKEGLPKVIGEAMTMGVPSIYINECYTVDYIKDGVNGFGVATLDEMIGVVQLLLDFPEKYRLLSINAMESIQPYLWKNVIRDYEAFFLSLLSQ